MHPRNKERINQRTGQRDPSRQQERRFKEGRNNYNDRSNKENFYQDQHRGQYGKSRTKPAGERRMDLQQKIEMLVEEELAYILEIRSNQVVEEVALRMRRRESHAN